MSSGILSIMAGVCRLRVRGCLWVGGWLRYVFTHLHIIKNPANCRYGKGCMADCYNEQAPRNFVPVYDAPTPAATASTQSPAQRQQQKQQYQDLITRYGLSSRITPSRSNSEGVIQPGTESTNSSTANEELQTSAKQKEKGGWSSSKVDRQAL